MSYDDLKEYGSEAAVKAVSHARRVLLDRGLNDCCSRLVNYANKESPMRVSQAFPLSPCSER